MKLSLHHISTNLTRALSSGGPRSTSSGGEPRTHRMSTSGEEPRTFGADFFLLDDLAAFSVILVLILRGVLISLTGEAGEAGFGALSSSFYFDGRISSSEFRFWADSMSVDTRLTSQRNSTIKVCKLKRTSGVMESEGFFEEPFFGATILVTSSK